jgi:hypothetical protein
MGVVVTVTPVFSERNIPQLRPNGCSIMKIWTSSAHRPAEPARPRGATGDHGSAAPVTAARRGVRIFFNDALDTASQPLYLG